MKATMKNIQIKRDVLGPFVSWLVYFNGDFVGVPENDTSYNDVVALANQFLNDYNNGNVSARYK